MQVVLFKFERTKYAFVSVSSNVLQVSHSETESEGLFIAGKGLGREIANRKKWLAVYTRCIVFAVLVSRSGWDLYL
jgi:hypothetical protein